ncbi:Cerato-platanin [Dentipellis sp. KUC8613]|nr:Cerato-platanin [Dentipellis sp. KUC8613]
MKFTLALVFSVLSTLAAALPAEDIPTATVNVRYDQTYDNSGESLSVVACSDGPNGLLTKGFTTFGSLPGFPNIGAAQAVAGWNSPNCGTCWKLTYNGKSINVIAVDHAGDGFNLSLEAMNTLTNGQAVFDGIVQATATQVAASQCGL